MRKSLFVGALALVVVATALTIAFASHQRGFRHPTLIRVVEHAVNETVTDTGPAGDSPGDIFSWRNPVFNATNKTRIGHDQGDCIRIDPAAGFWECRWLTSISGRGQIMVEGNFSDTSDTILAITGGTGEFRNARGQMHLSLRPSGTEYNFDFLILP